MGSLTIACREDTLTEVTSRLWAVDFLALQMGKKIIYLFIIIIILVEWKLSFPFPTFDLYLNQIYVTCSLDQQC